VPVLQVRQLVLEGQQLLAAVWLTMAVRSNRPSRSKSSSRRITSAGFLTVIDTVPRVVAGGMTNWIRSPVGRVAARSGRSWLICWSEKVATAVASDRQRSAVSSGACHRFPAGDRLDHHFAGPVDADLEDAGSVEPGAQRRRNSMTDVESPHQAAADASPSIGLRRAHRSTALSSYTDEKSTSRAT
jgi:hypothetical protein